MPSCIDMGLHHRMASVSEGSCASLSWEPPISPCRPSTRWSRRGIRSW
ncbi:MAG: hypothetical protein EPO38_10450, partial [Rhizorhabdus sp.]